MGSTTSGWRTVDAGRVAWFDAPSLVDAARFAQHVVLAAPDTLIDLRSTGVRVRSTSPEHEGAVSAAAHEFGLSANPAVLQQLALVLETAAPGETGPFWQRVLGYEAGSDGSLIDPLRRDPTVRLTAAGDPRPLRDRIHLDVARREAEVEQLGLGPGGPPYGLCHADPDGTVFDLVSGDPLGEGSGISDWQVVFTAMACYRVASPAQQCDLATAAAELADAEGFPLVIDLRPGWVVLDSGKDLAEAQAHGLDLDFATLAANCQSAARRIGAIPEPGRVRFVQLVVGGVDVDAIRTFWAAALGYRPDSRPGVTDIVDPRRVDPVLVFQQLDQTQPERLGQRSRIVIELSVPLEFVRDRVDLALAAGGRALDDAPGRHRIADPAGNEVVILGDR